MPRRVPDQLRPKVPKFAARTEEAESKALVASRFKWHLSTYAATFSL